MNQFQYSDKRKQRIEEFLRRREARLYGHLGRLYHASVYAKRQPAQATQPPPVGKPDEAEVIEGTFVVVSSSSDGISQQKLKRSEALRQAVYRLDARIIGAWVLAIICGYFGGYWLAVDLLAFMGVLFYYKLVKAAHTSCPGCVQPFRSVWRWLFRVSGQVCQSCGLSLRAIRNRQGR